MVNSIDASDHLKAVIRPTSELHLAVLVIKREPSDVDGTGGHEDA